MHGKTVTFRFGHAGQHIGGTPPWCCTATQVGSLVQELRENLSPGCYSILAASYAVCLPDMAALEGCCSSDCKSALGLVSALPACLCWQLVQAWGKLVGSLVLVWGHVQGNLMLIACW
jgi:hypothetical protein